MINFQKISFVLVSMIPGKAHSFELTTIKMTDRIYEYLDKCDIQMSVFPDLSKAFDTLDHTILIY